MLYAAWCISGSIVAILFVIMLMKGWSKVEESKEEVYSLEKLMEVHDEIFSKIKFRLTTANWWTRRSFIKKYGRATYEAFLATEQTAKTS